MIASHDTKTTTSHIEHQVQRNSGDNQRTSGDAPPSRTCSFLATEKMAATSLLVSPNHLLWTDDARMLMKTAPLSLASALASIVFPVPGGP